VHYACSRNASVECIEALAETNPGWILAKNNAGLSPIQVLSKNGRINDRIVNLFSRYCGSEVFSSVDAYGNTALHSAMGKTDAVALRGLMKAFPNALQMKTRYNDTPLSLACLRNVRADVLREIAEATWQGAEYGSLRSSPLLLCNRAGQTPMSIVLDEYRKASVHVSTECYRTAATTTPADTLPAFDVLATLVKLLHYGPGPESEGSQSLLVASLSLHRYDVRLPPSFIRSALALNPREAAVLDGDGNYPMHIEAGIPVEKMTLLDSPHPCRSCGDYCCQRLDILPTLMDIYPQASKTSNQHGAFPLGLMVRNGRRWDKTFALVLRSCPEAIHDEVLSVTIVPRLLAKVEHCCGLDTLYGVIRSRPDIVH
jgi:hypothetical protein